MPPETDLSDRELEILRLVATGASNKEIAQKLVISPNTVKVHLRNVFAKVGAASRTEAALFALRRGLVDQVSEPASPALDEETLPVRLPENGREAGLASEAVEAPLAGVPVARPELEAAPRKWRRWLTGGLLVASAGILLLAAFFLLGGAALASQPTLVPTLTQAVLSPSQRWQDEAILPEARSGAAATSFEDGIYVVGGATPGGVTSSLLHFSLGTKTWQTLASKPTPASDIQAARLGDRMYVPGGRVTSGQPTDLVEVYDLRQDSWSQATRLPAPRSAYALAAFEGRLYLFGGWDGSQYTDSVFMYDPTSDTWQSRSPLPGRRGLAAAVVREELIFLIGGTDGSAPLARLDTYTPQRDRAGQNPWEERAAMPEGRSGPAAVLMADQVYVLGGQGSSPPPDGGLPPLQYQPFNDRWVVLDPSPVAVGAQPVVLSLETRLYVAGGRTPGGMSAFTQSYQAVYTINLPTIQK